jgi:hypothetical protein
MTEESDDSKNNLFTSSNSDWASKTPSPSSIDDWSRAVVEGIDRLCCDGGVRDPEGSRTLVAATRSCARASAETPDKTGTSTDAEEHDAPVLSQKPERANKAKAKACVRGKEVSEAVTFRGSPPPDPHIKWVGQQDATEIPNGVVCWKLHLDSQTDSWSSRMIRDAGESSFRWNKENVLSSKNISLFSMWDQRK